MKNTRILFALLIATVAGLSAVMLASRWLLQQGSNGITKVAVAAADIKRLGQQITPEAAKAGGLARRQPAARRGPGRRLARRTRHQGQPRAASRCWSPS